jgi:hypothetical protein
VKVFIDSNIPIVVTLADTDRACDILCGTHGISARDAVHAAV